MFEFLFKYPAQVFSRGTFVLAGALPVWLLIVAILAAAAALGWFIRQRSNGSARVHGWRTVGVWILQSALAALLLLMLWHPALSVATLRPQQNIVAVVVDDSSSMSTRDTSSGSRLQQAVSVLNSGLIQNLQKRFQVRLYMLSDQLTRVQKPDELKADGPSTHIGESLKQVVADASSLPIGAVVLLSDGSDNSGGIDLETVSEIRRQRIPIHTIGFGREKMAHDIELTDVQIPQRAMPDSRLPATISFHQNGYSGSKVKITLRDGAKILTSHEVTLKPDGVQQTEQIMFNAGGAGVRTIETEIEPQANEENAKNNKLTRLVNVDSRKAKILYLEGEPRWEFKFLRRAIEDDHNLHLASILRTTQNKIYVQDDYGDAPKAIKDGFPTKVDDLFDFDGLIIGSSEAAYLSASQQDMIHQFVDRRGGGLLFLGGKDALADGDYRKSALNDLFPVILPDKKGTFVRAPANVELTAAGRDSAIVRIDEDPEKNAQHWKKMPYLLSFQNPGQPKPGATVLMDAVPMQGGRLPLLIIENFGRGRTAVFATGASWRGWQMQMPLADKTHEMFYTQLLRWLVNDTPKRVVGSTPKQLIADETNVKLRAEVRDHTYLPASDSTVEGHILGPEGIAESVEMRPDPVEPGVYTADYTTPKAGSYLVEMLAKHGNEEIGRDVLTFRREDGVAENFHVEQNRELLEKLSSETGGRYYTPDEAKKLGNEISYSEAGITVRETKDLWDMPVVFLALLMIRSTEWLLRRKWGVI